MFAITCTYSFHFIAKLKTCLITGINNIVQYNTIANIYTEIKHTLTNVTKSSIVSTTSVMARYSSTFLHILIILRTSDSSNDSSSAEVPCRIPKNNEIKI